MSTTSTQWKHLERRAGSRYKQLFIKGRRIPARTLYGQHMNAEAPRSAEQLAEDFGLPLEAVREAIAYCDADPSEIREDFEYEEALMEASGMNEPDYKFHGRPKRLTPQERAAIRERFDR